MIGHASELGLDPARVLIAGDSAGGNLAAVTALQCREDGGATPVGQVLIYPVIDPTFDTSSYQAYASGYVSGWVVAALTGVSGGAGTRYLT